VKTDLTPLEVESFKLPIGKHCGKTLIEVDLSGDRAHLIWIARTWARKDRERIREHVIAYIRMHPTRPKGTRGRIS
jgi:hypothetical protein